MNSIWCKKLFVKFTNGIIFLLLSMILQINKGMIKICNFLTILKYNRYTCQYVFYHCYYLWPLHYTNLSIFITQKYSQEQQVTVKLSDLFWSCTGCHNKKNNDKTIGRVTQTITSSVPPTPYIVTKWVM